MANPATPLYHKVGLGSVFSSGPLKPIVLPPVAIWAASSTRLAADQSRSHVYILDETRPLNRTAFEKKHKDLRENAVSAGEQRRSYTV